MSNLVEKRNRIREAVPHLASASGAIASFQTDMRSPLEEIKIHFNPVQSGTGTPSPTNVRPLSGWTGCDIYISPTQDASQGNQIPVSWSDDAGTVYGGYANPMTGEGTMEWYMRQLNSSTPRSDFSNGIVSEMGLWVYRTYDRGTTWQSHVVSQNPSNDLYCDKMAVNTVRGATNATGASYVVKTEANQGAYYGRRLFFAWDNMPTDRTQYLDYLLNTIQPTLVWRLETPIPFTFTPILPLKTLIGTNNIWANATGDVDVKYWKH